MSFLIFDIVIITSQVYVLYVVAQPIYIFFAMILIPSLIICVNQDGGNSSSQHSYE